MAEQDPIEIATRALRHRDRSRRELDELLARAGVDEREEALDTLERVGYIDDERFAGARAGALASRGYGDEWIRRDLARHRVGTEIALAAIAGLAPEADRAGALVERLGRTAKTGAHLTRKGFGPDALERALGIDVAD